MAELSILEEHPNFSSASRRAKVLSIQLQESTCIRRITTGWTVLVPSCAVSALTTSEYLPDSGSRVDQNDDDYLREVVVPLIEEFQSDQDSWARSEEDGWFYED